MPVPLSHIMIYGASAGLGMLVGGLDVMGVAFAILPVNIICFLNQYLAQWYEFITQRLRGNFNFNFSRKPYHYMLRLYGHLKCGSRHVVETEETVEIGDIAIKTTRRVVTSKEYIVSRSLTREG